uniref:Uncharacterized protein n=1 Tax=Myoviridae sp. ctCo31 TaxID=2825053 RepID=A0A8S5UMY1_9CAUD|nr:MAG TPA: hypothetical protein [Myoviridae sp. ctCo31]
MSHRYQKSTYLQNGHHTHELLLYLTASGH